MSQFKTFSFLGCDWGTSSLRMRLIDAENGNCITETFSPEGIAVAYNEWIKAALPPEQRINFFSTYLQKQIKLIEQQSGKATAGMPLILSGMASSGIGMIELPYADLPFSAIKNLYIKHIEANELFPHNIILISGCKTVDDVMRGEEIQLAGCIDQAANGNHLFIFPGTHSKHIMVNNGVATGIQTFMTGEFFALLSEKSVLAAGIEARGNYTDADCRRAFETGIEESRQYHLLHQAFRVRINQLFSRFTKKQNYFYLSGLLIGQELQALLPFHVEAITIVGEEKLAVNYIHAMQYLGFNRKLNKLDAANAAIKGQVQVFKNSL